MLASHPESSLAPAAAHHLLQLIEELADAPTAPSGAQRIQALALVDMALQAPRLAYHMIVAVLQRYLVSLNDQHVLVKHVADPNWSRPYPLAVQEYGPLLKGDPMLHLGLMGLQQQSSWPREELRPLSAAVSNEDPSALLAAARVLRDDFATIREDAEVLGTRLTALKQIKARSSMHVAQVEAYLGACLGPELKGRDAVDLGCGGGELVEALKSLGAHAEGSELGGTDRNLLGVDPQARFDLVVATGLFEPGAFVWPEEGITAAVFEDRAHELIAAAAAICKPGGRIIVRNISYAIPFSPRAIAAAGLRYERQLLPLVTPSFGGRMAIWQKA